MGKIVLYSCSVCNTTRDSSKNGWLTGQSYHDSYTVLPWTDENANKPDIDHICSDNCLLTLIRRATNPTLQDKQDHKPNALERTAQYFERLSHLRADEPNTIIPEHVLPPMDKVLQHNQRFQDEVARNDG